MVTECFVIVFLYVFMLIASWKITVIFTLIVATNIILLTQTISKKIKKIGVIRAQVQAEFYESINNLRPTFRTNLIIYLYDRKQGESCKSYWYVFISISNNFFFIYVC